MFSMKKNYLPFLLLLLSAAAAVAGSGLSYHRFMTPRSTMGEFEGISGDGWVRQGATITLRDLAPRGNRIDLHFDQYQWPVRSTSHFRARVCGAVVSEFVSEPNAVRRVQLPGACEPRVLTLEVLDPFTPSATDHRQLGAKLASVAVGSRVGVPILAWPILLAAFAAIAALSLGAAALLEGRWRMAAAAVPLAAIFFLQRSLAPDFEKALALWLCLIALAAGVLAAKRWGRAFPEGRWMPSADLIAAAIVIGAALLRFHGLHFGLPARYHPDEVPKFNAIMDMVHRGDLNPRYFRHPSLLLYSTYFTNQIFHAVLTFLGVAREWSETLIFSGRIVSATAGTLSVYLIYRIAARLFSKSTGLLAAAFLAVMPLHVTCSRYVKEDALLTFVTLAAVAVLLKAVQEDRKKLLLAAGFLAGCSASVKYSGMLSAAILMAAPWLRSRTWRPDPAYLAWTVGALCMMPIGFVVCTPYSVLDTNLFLNHFNYEKRHMEQGHTTFIDAWSQFWMFHFHYSIIPGVSLPGALLAAAGVGFLAWRRRTEDLFVVMLVLLFYLPAEYVKAKPAPQPERYILPCLPFLAAAAGELLRVLRARRSTIAAAVLAAVMIGFPAVRSAELASEIMNDTRAQMADWMREHLRPGSSVLIDWKPYAPGITENDFELVYMRRDRIIPGLDLRALRETGKDYLSLSSLFYSRYFMPNADPASREQIRRVFRQLPIVKEIAPKYGTYGFHNPSITVFSLRENGKR